MEYICQSHLIYVLCHHRGFQAAARACAQFAGRSLHYSKAMPARAKGACSHFAERSLHYLKSTQSAGKDIDNIREFYNIG
jgi:hypothetical protein